MQIVSGIKSQDVSVWLWQFYQLSFQLSSSPIATHSRNSPMLLLHGAIVCRTLVNAGRQKVRNVFESVFRPNIRPVKWRCNGVFAMSRQDRCGIRHPGLPLHSSVGPNVAAELIIRLLDLFNLNWSDFPFLLESSPRYCLLFSGRTSSQAWSDSHRPTQICAYLLSRPPWSPYP